MKFEAIRVLLAVFMIAGTTIKGDELNLVPDDFALTSEEESQMGKWKNLSMDDLAKDAFNGDAAGLYMIGMCYFVGFQGFTIDVDKANNLFSMSASLGFAPSLRRVGYMYLEEKKKPFLALVYFNLAASHGHPELAFAYHNTRALLVKDSGLCIAKEIEKIAAQKQEQIEANSRNAKLPENRVGEINKVLIRGNIVTIDDAFYDNEYWVGVLRRARAKEQEAPGTNQVE